MFELVDVPEEERYEARIDGVVAGRVEYEVVDGVRELLHTEVDPRFEGHGVGSQLAAAVFDDARRRGEQVVVRCPFLKRWLQHHPEVRDLVI
jgi:hypothetical protein